MQILFCEAQILLLFFLEHIEICLFVHSKIHWCIGSLLVQ